MVQFLPKSNERGDTIIEVVIAIAIVASVLLGAFAMTGRSTKAVRDSEEHAQALQLLQGQVERLRAIAPTNTYASIPGTFCFDPSGNLIPYTVATCTRGFYVFKNQKIADGGINPSTFAMNVSWASVTNNTATEQLMYKVRTK